MHKFENKEVKVVVDTTQIPQITHLRDFHFLCWNLGIGCFGDLSAQRKNVSTRDQSSVTIVLEAETTPWLFGAF